MLKMLVRYGPVCRPVDSEVNVEVLPLDPKSKTFTIYCIYFP
jgi:hypothetical protein